MDGTLVVLKKFVLGFMVDKKKQHLIHTSLSITRGAKNSQRVSCFKHPVGISDVAINITFKTYQGS